MQIGHCLVEASEESGIPDLALLPEPVQLDRHEVRCGPAEPAEHLDVQYVALDEVHKVIEDMNSVSADVTRQLTEWVRDGSIRGLIGFSGTAEAYRRRFAEVWLNR